MNRLLIVLVLIVAGVGGLGYYLGWFRIGSDSADGTTHVTLTVDEKNRRGQEEGREGRA